MKNLLSPLLVLISWVIVAFGQPSWVALLSPLAASLGYALFWREALKIPSFSRRFWVASGWFFLVQAIQLSWMTAIEYQGIYILFAYAAFCGVLGLQFGLLTLAVKRLPHMAVAALWTLFEWGRLYFLCGFSWNPVGLTLTAFLPSMQVAAVFGVLGLSFLVVLTNLAFLSKSTKGWAILTLFPYIFGLAHLWYHQENLSKSPPLSVGLVQTGLMPSQKIPLPARIHEFIHPSLQWERILTALKESKRSFDLIVLPEHAVPLPAEHLYYNTSDSMRLFETTLGAESRDKVLSLASRDKFSNATWAQAVADIFSAEVVIGLEANEEQKHHAAAFHFTPQKLQSNRYEKQILVPLGEYLPFAWLKPFTEKYGIGSFFTPGIESKVFAGKVPLSVSICYEETFSHLIREGRVKGAELLVNVTNDNWYPDSKLAAQHFVHGRVRAVENGVPLVRACNTSVTAAVDSLGRTLGQITEETETGVLAVSVPTYHYATLYTFWGDWGILTVCAFSLLLSWWFSRKSFSLKKLKEMSPPAQGSAG